ncbi:hypothetical protein [Pectobacterium cacticida]|uniref:hypothetical protein n=1 Tax=Pectobacterium cacticida TaxID=69221 RepID=UPI0039881B18
MTYAIPLSPITSVLRRTEIHDTDLPCRTRQYLRAGKRCGARAGAEREDKVTAVAAAITCKLAAMAGWVSTSQVWPVRYLEGRGNVGCCLPQR